MQGHCGTCFVNHRCEPMIGGSLTYDVVQLPDEGASTASPGNTTGELTSPRRERAGDGFRLDELSRMDKVFQRGAGTDIVAHVLGDAAFPSRRCGSFLSESSCRHDRKSSRLARTFVVLSECQRLREAFGVVFAQVLIHGSDIRAALHAWWRQASERIPLVLFVDAHQTRSRTARRASRSLDMAPVVRACQPNTFSFAFAHEACCERLTTHPSSADPLRSDCESTFRSTATRASRRRHCALRRAQGRSARTAREPENWSPAKGKSFVGSAFSSRFELCGEMGLTSQSPAQ